MQHVFLRSARRIALVTAMGLTAGFAQATTIPVLPQFDAGLFLPGAAIDNRYFPLTVGMTRALEARGTDADGSPIFERGELSVSGPGRVILGVQTTQLVDRAFEDGVLVEETYDYYAQDSAGNVWYMGEDVTNFVYDADGNLIGTNSSSSWIAGVNGALPGFAMPADPLVGFAYYQEFAPSDDALDEGLILGFLDSLSLAGMTFEDVLKVFETSAIDPGLREIKYYAPGFGLIRADEQVDANFENPALSFALVSPVPVPSTASLMLGGLAVLAALGQRRRKRRQGTGLAA